MTFTTYVPPTMSPPVMTILVCLQVNWELDTYM